MEFIRFRRSAPITRRTLEYWGGIANNGDTGESLDWIDYEANGSTLEAINDLVIALREHTDVGPHLTSAIRGVVAALLLADRRRGNAETVIHRLISGEAPAFRSSRYDDDDTGNARAEIAEAIRALRRASLCLKVNRDHVTEHNREVIAALDGRYTHFIAEWLRDEPK